MLVFKQLFTFLRRAVPLHQNILTVGKVGTAINYHIKKFYKIGYWSRFIYFLMIYQEQNGGVIMRRRPRGQQIEHHAQPVATNIKTFTAVTLTG